MSGKEPEEARRQPRHGISRPTSPLKKKKAGEKGEFGGTLGVGSSSNRPRFQKKIGGGGINGKTSRACGGSHDGKLRRRVVTVVPYKRKGKGGGATHTGRI